MRAFRDPLVQQVIAQERLHPHDTALCNKASILPIGVTGGLYVPFPCNGLTLITSYAPPIYGTSEATSAYTEFIESSTTPTSAQINQGLYNVSFPAAPTHTTPVAYLEYVGVSPYPSVTFAGSPTRNLNLIVSTAITKGETFEIQAYSWNPVTDTYASTYAGAPFTSKYGIIADFAGIFQNGSAIPQLTRIYFVLYACANTICT
jgi:hypothetical protein